MPVKKLGGLVSPAAAGGSSDSRHAPTDLQLVELGSSGLNRQSGYVFDDPLPELQGLRGAKVYREMSKNDPVVGAMLFAIEMLLRQSTWRVEPASTDAEDVLAADFVESAMDDMEQTWQDTISEVLTMLTYGWSFMETVFKRRGGESLDPTQHSRWSDGAIGWRKIALRGQDTLFRWQFEADGTLLAMEQVAPPDYNVRTIPADRALLFRTKTERNNPEGQSILRAAVTSWRYKHRIQNIEAVGIERDLAGLPVVYVDPTILGAHATTEQKGIADAYRRLVSNIKRNEQEGVILPSAYDMQGHRLYELTLLSTGGSRQFSTDPIIARYDQRMATSVLADFVLLGQEQMGSFALATSKTRIFGLALSAWLDSIAGVFNRVALPKLFALNGWPTHTLPTLVPGNIEAPDLTLLGDYVSKLAGSGMQLFPDDQLDSYLRKVADLPEKSKSGGV